MPSKVLATEGLFRSHHCEARAARHSCIANLESGTKIFSCAFLARLESRDGGQTKTAGGPPPMPNGITEQHIVIVHGKPQTVILDRISKSSWIAAGVYNGKRIEMPGSSWLLALSRWQEAALDRVDS